ncbi:MAG: ribosome silencing factor [Bacteroidota bacterium]|nr:ribosome silencing factor [Bacteroidota bacterium]MEC8756635.1 ribosome silencing factor [Bacteroidota bacterium]
MDLLQAILTSLDDNKANDIVLMDLRGIDEAITDFFVVCHGTSTTHVGSLSQNLRAEVKEEQGSIPMGNSGHDTGQWIVLDYFDIVVHIFLEETRSLYLLEELWSDATCIPIDKDFSVTAIENNYE